MKTVVSGANQGMAADDLLSDLTDAQRAAVTHGEGPLLILAAAGSGKTRVITRRVAYLLQQGVRPGNILAITFTNKAAGEMRERVEQLVPGSRVWVSTFHSFGARILRQYADRIGLDKNFTIYDTDDQIKLVEEAIKNADIPEGRVRPAAIAGAISKAKNQLLTPARYSERAFDFFSQTAARVYTAYDKKLRAANAMDFDDLLFIPAMTLTHNEELRAELDSRFKYVLVDEYQDTNHTQYVIANRLCLNYRNLCTVGDPDQSIYKWRGSDIQNILDFERDYSDATVIALEKNYRSTQSILAAAGTVIAHNRKRKKKALVTDNPAGEAVHVLTFDTGLDEAEGIAKRIKEAVGRKAYRYRDVAVFLRVNALTRALEAAFVQHGVPFQIVKGLAFFDRKENRDVLAYLRLLVNPQDPVSFMRVVNEPARGVGKTSLERLQTYAAAKELSLFAAAGEVATIPEIKGKAATGLRTFYQLMSGLRAKLDHPPHDLIKMVIEESGYKESLRQSQEEDDVDRLANVEEMITAARQFHAQDESRTLGDFLEQITLASDVDSWDDQQDRVSVMTLHAAKGLEFPVVYLMAVEQGLLPHQRGLEHDDDLEEERRLCFVGMTRAMRELYLTHARLREFRGQAMYAVPSMFLEELPPEVEHDDLSGYKNTARAVFDEWRGGGRAAADGWAEAGVRTRPPVPPAASDGDTLDVGFTVEHGQYGIGFVTDVSGVGALRKVKIRFSAAGEKTFVADMVKVRVVGRSLRPGGGRNTGRTDQPAGQ
jgi:DNA helicase-2/ATP-dependent DNA helicase PcrA